ncbi:MAG: ATP-binding protein, partial [Anaerotignaceae bacterium]
IVYDKWDFESILPYGSGLSMLFEGPSGTGKTMAAQIIAGELGLELYKVDISQVISKYIGETEKNLNEIFTEAQKNNVILFFDEMVAIFGKRGEVKDSHDKHINVEVAFLLQKVEEYQGISVMATNYLKNIDQAFIRRINYIIHFPFPQEEERTKIWKNVFPANMPMGKDIDYEYLGRQFELAGGSIKNTAVSAAFMAARDNTACSMKHILLSLIHELGKQDKVMLKTDFGEYAFLINL